MTTPLTVVHYRHRSEIVPCWLFLLMCTCDIMWCMTTVRASKGTPLVRVYSYSYIAVNPQETDSNQSINSSRNHAEIWKSLEITEI